MKNLIKLVTVMALFSNLAWAVEIIPMPENEEKYIQETILDSEIAEDAVYKREDAFLGRQGLMCFANYRLVVKLVDDKIVPTKDCIKIEDVLELNKNYKLDDSKRYDNDKLNMYLNIQKGENAIKEAKQF